MIAMRAEAICLALSSSQQEVLPITSVWRIWVPNYPLLFWLHEPVRENERVLVRFDAERR
jgi:hypothetical protein